MEFVPQIFLNFGWPTVQLASNTCASCVSRFKRKDHLKTHVETVHEKARNYACNLCERRFGQKFHLAIHVSAVHEGKKPHACHLCTHKSARKSGLQRHLKTVHNILPPKQVWPLKFFCYSFLDMLYYFLGMHIFQKAEASSMKKCAHKERNHFHGFSCCVLLCCE